MELLTSELLHNRYLIQSLLGRKTGRTFSEEEVKAITKSYVTKYFNLVQRGIVLSITL